MVKGADGGAKQAGGQVGRWAGNATISRVVGTGTLSVARTRA